METKKIYDLHREHTQWLSKLSFFTGEIKFIQKYLEEIIVKNNNKEVLANAEHFQNQLILQKEQIDTLSHEIKLHENSLEKNINANPVAADHRDLPDHKIQREKIEVFEKIFAETKKELQKYWIQVL